MKELIVLSPGTKVTVGGDIEAYVQSVQVSAKNHVTYQLSWWSGRDQHSNWFEEWEIDRHEVVTEQTRLGFIENI